MSLLSILLWSCLLAFVQSLVGATGAMQQVGLPALAGNREGLPEIGGWAGRALRAHRNMLESLVIFAALVLIAQVSGKAADGTILLGAQLFLWARLVYAVVYIVGLPWVRTLVWAVAVLGMALMFIRLF